MLGSKLGATLVYNSDPKMSGSISGLGSFSVYFSVSAVSEALDSLPSFSVAFFVLPVLGLAAPPMRSLSFANSAALIPLAIAIGSTCSMVKPCALSCALSFAISASAN